jgi:Fe-S cluster assembly ATP-binding protein
MSELILNGLVVLAGGKRVIDGLNLKVSSGEVHVIMGRNGSGKSSLANALSAKPGYVIDAGSATLDGFDLLSADATQRAQMGLFVASQYPTEIPGLSNGHFLRAMSNARADASGVDQLGAGLFLKEAKQACVRLGIPEDFLQRSLNSGMSGGERKRNELLQLRFFHPKFAILDEIDSGLDVDAWAKSMEFVKQEQERSGFGLIIITHYAKIAERFTGAKVHVLADGLLAMSGDATLARSVEDNGFQEALL